MIALPRTSQGQVHHKFQLPTTALPDRRNHGEWRYSLHGNLYGHVLDGRLLFIFWLFSFFAFRSFRVVLQFSLPSSLIPWAASRLTRVSFSQPASSSFCLSRTTAQLHRSTRTTRPLCTELRIPIVTSVLPLSPLSARPLPILHSSSLGGLPENSHTTTHSPDLSGQGTRTVWYLTFQSKPGQPDHLT
ncbi:hypothetical protein EDB80DRAFT_40824 [Ilyonectria destructans]|nr:hypothetical protein EDB80DRAFT_40824 [Ilyonectria destructans]